MGSLSNVTWELVVMQDERETLILSLRNMALLRMLREGPDGFKGGLSAGNYASITGASPATTTRDLADMVEKGALTRIGELRHARYHVAISPASSEISRQE
jgi:Fic family protein